jgi:predicted porin
MKAKLLAAVIATCFAAPVLAQSSVTVYGIADAGLMKSTGTPMKLVSGIADGSRIGFKGTEDIGGGWKAIFNLEARVELDNGTQSPTLLNDNQGQFLTKNMTALPASLLTTVKKAFQVPGSAAVNPEKALFDRTSMVGLITPAGAILLGRMYTPGYEVFAAADAFESGTTGQWGTITGGNAGFTALGADIRSQKSIQYRVADPKTGLGGSLMYGVKGSGYLGRYNKFNGAAVTYKANGFDVGIGYNRGYDQGDAVSLTSTTIGGSYTYGDYKFFAGIHDQRNKNSVLLREYIGAWDASIAPGLVPLGAATAAALRNVFVTNITQNTRGRRRLGPDRYALPHRRRPHHGFDRAPERPHLLQQRCDHVRDRLRLQPVQAHRRLHRRGQYQEQP